MVIYEENNVQWSEGRGKSFFCPVPGTIEILKMEGRIWVTADKPSPDQTVSREMVYRPACYWHIVCTQLSRKSELHSIPTKLWTLQLWRLPESICKCRVEPHGAREKKEKKNDKAQLFTRLHSMAQFMSLSCQVTNTDEREQAIKIRFCVVTQ